MIGRSGMRSRDGDGTVAVWPREWRGGAAPRIAHPQPGPPTDEKTAAEIANLFQSRHHRVGSCRRSSAAPPCARPVSTPTTNVAPGTAGPCRRKVGARTSQTGARPRTAARRRCTSSGSERRLIDVGDAQLERGREPCQPPPQLRPGPSALGGWGIEGAGQKQRRNGRKNADAALALDPNRSALASQERGQCVNPLGHAGYSITTERHIILPSPLGERGDDYGCRYAFFFWNNSRRARSSARSLSRASWTAFVCHLTASSNLPHSA